MDNEKNMVEASVGAKDSDFPSEHGSRARNRTVMLTPEVTGQVRARIAQELDSGFQTPGGFQTPMARGSGEPPPSGAYHPAGGVKEKITEGYTGAQKYGVMWTKETPVIGFLVSFDGDANGEIYPLRSGRLIVTSQAASGSNCLVVPDETISPMHAIMRISPSGEIQVLDQLSEYGTKIKRFGSTEEEALSGDKSTVEHGDIIKFGNHTFHVCVIAKGEE